MNSLCFDISQVFCFLSSQIKVTVSKTKRSAKPLALRSGWSAQRGAPQNAWMGTTPSPLHLHPSLRACYGAAKPALAKAGEPGEQTPSARGGTSFPPPLQHPSPRVTAGGPAEIRAAARGVLAAVRCLHKLTASNRSGAGSRARAEDAPSVPRSWQKSTGSRGQVCPAASGLIASLRLGYRAC